MRKQVGDGSASQVAYGRCACPAGNPGDEASSLPDSLLQALPKINSLTPREHAVLKMLGRGHDNRSIARALKINESTVKCHITSILVKLGLESRLQAGLVAFAEAQAQPPSEPDLSRRSDGQRSDGHGPRAV
jgi:DNA-binding NarL/FixJ family response regulator